MISKRGQFYEINVGLIEIANLIIWNNLMTPIGTILSNIITIKNLSISVAHQIKKKLFV